MRVHAVKICRFMLQINHASYLCIYSCIAMIIAYVRFLIPLMSSKFYKKKLFKKMVSNFLQITLINIEKNMYPYISFLCYISTSSSLHSLILKITCSHIFLYFVIYLPVPADISCLLEHLSQPSFSLFHPQFLVTSFPTLHHTHSAFVLYLPLTLPSVLRVSSSVDRSRSARCISSLLCAAIFIFVLLFTLQL